MAVLYAGGYELGGSGQLEGTSTAGTVSAVTSPVKSGVYAMRANPTTTGTGLVTHGGYLYPEATPIVWDKADIWMQFWFRADTLPGSNDEPICNVITAAAAQKLEVRITSGGLLRAYNSAGTLLATGATVLATATWYRIGVRCGTSATVGAWEVTINDVSEISGTANTSATNSGAVQLGKVANRNGQTVDFFYDNLVIDDAGYALGPTDEILVAQINGAGAINQWTAGTGASDYTQVDELPTNDSDYVQSTAQNDVAQFTVEESATLGITGTIKHVTAIFRANRAGASNGTCTFRLRSASTNKDTNTSNVAVGLGLKVVPADVDPATSAAWTTAGFDGIEVGIIDSEAADRSRLFGGYAQVFFTPAFPAHHYHQQMSA